MKTEDLDADKIPTVVVPTVVFPMVVDLSLGFVNVGPGILEALYKREVVDYVPICDYNMMDDAPVRNRLLDADENRGLAPVFVSNSKKVVIQEGTRIKHLTNEEIRKIQDGDYEKPKATYAWRKPQEVNHRVFGKEKANFSPSHKVAKVPIFFGSERLRVIDVHGNDYLDMIMYINCSRLFGSYVFFSFFLYRRDI